MEGQLVAGQWVEVSIEDLHTPILLTGFVLSLRANEVLLTFPDLLVLPEGLESEAQVIVRYNNSCGNYTAVGRIVRVASGPPVTVTFKRLIPMGSRPSVRSPAVFPVALHIVSSRVTPMVGPEGTAGTVQNLSDSGVLLRTSILLAVGDTVRLDVPAGPDPLAVHGRVIRVFESEGQFGVGIEFVHESDDEHEAWLRFAAERRQGV
jgi:hypothetical protein